MCACVIKREKWRETEWISVCGLCGLVVCVWDVNRGEVHWASELVQSGFWHARAVHTNFIDSRWHDSPYGLTATACLLWTYPQILLSVRPVMLHALTRINSAVWFPSNPGRRATSGLFAPLSLFSSPHPVCFAWQGLCCVVGCVTFRRVDFCSVWSICLYSHQSGRFWITAGNTKDLILPTWFICTDLRSPAECKENISSVSSKTFRRPRSSYIVRWYFQSIVQMYYAGI